MLDYFSNSAFDTLRQRRLRESFTIGGTCFVNLLGDKMLGGECRKEHSAPVANDFEDVKISDAAA